MTRFTDAALHDIERKLDAGTPLSMDDGLALYRTPDLHGLGALARKQKERKSGKKVFYVLNRYINSTNVCYAGCKFCSFAVDDISYSHHSFGELGIEFGIMGLSPAQLSGAMMPQVSAANVAV